MSSQPRTKWELECFINLFSDKDNVFQLHVKNPVSCKSLEKCFKTWNDCSTGCDYIPTSFIKTVAEFLISPMTFILINFIELSQFPDVWKVTQISPILEINQPIELKDNWLVQFYQNYQKFIKQLFWNKLPNLLKTDEHSEHALQFEIFEKCR